MLVGNLTLVDECAPRFEQAIQACPNSLWRNAGSNFLKRPPRPAQPGGFLPGALQLQPQFFLPFDNIRAMGAVLQATLVQFVDFVGL